MYISTPFRKSIFTQPTIFEYFKAAPKALIVVNHDIMNQRNLDHIYKIGIKRSVLNKMIYR